MSVALEVVRVFGLIVLVWFALVGWKLVRRSRAHNTRSLGAERGGN